ncbi:MAG: 4Fe-4S dicluster domain-containing protein [Thermodesulfobacteriota bacterium]
MNEVKEIFVRLDRCVGCHTCELACAVEHSAAKNLFAALAEAPRPRKRLYVETAAGLKLPVLCRHCEEAPCAAVCPTGAIWVDEARAVVGHRDERCIGCQLCVQACPFGMMGQRAESRITLKCDRCPDLETPACVDSCPVGALVYVASAGYGGDRRRAVVRTLAAAYLERGE